ncbi:probable LRR receptor-like serine/threonine-protein kinase At5g48740 isoform X1 [Gossypium hirsutum]|uniref:non-specific serine/threonine protein kinase n=1 Tax=Gossypium hirsutum TaxID=3635 RepID=A0A1U8P4P8_GOSHI|nr:probable LRR receptor-like serine/threonine-protein kinase At5g48740 isoform X1 [Gossypium hirsutum]
MALKLFWVSFTLFFGFLVVAFCDQDGFLSLSCGGAKSYVDSSKIKWVSDDTFITTGNTTTVEYAEGTSSSSSIALRFFPESRGRNCYKLPVENMSSIVLVRAQFVYKNYDGLEKPPAFSVSLGRAVVSTVNLTHKDPWIDEFLWPVSKDTLSFCLQAIPDGGAPVISSLEVRPLPRAAYQSGMEDIPNKSLRKSYRINSGYTNGSLRYPVDPFDRIWDADQSYTPFHSSPGFNIPLSFNLSSLKESPPLDVLQTARVLARQDVLHYNLPLDKLGDYYIVLYFASILPVSASFDILINGDVELSEFTIRTSEASTLYFKQKGIINLDIALRSIIFYPQINALEVYEIVDIPPETSSTTVSALQVIEQATGFDLGWQDDPCFPTPWDHIECKGSTVTSLDLSDINLRSISPTFGDLLDLKILNLHNTSLSGATQNLGSLQHLEKLNLSFNQLTSFGSDMNGLVNLRVLDLHNNSLQGIVPESLGELKNLHLLNLENNKLQGTLPLSLNRESLEVRTSGNLCLSFSTMTCNDVSSNPSIETPQVTIVTNRKHRAHRHLAIILGAAAGTLFALLLTSLLVLLYINKRKTEATYTTSASIGMRNWNAERIFSYKEIKAATNNFKEVIGRGSFGSVYLGKLSDGKPVAVKVRFDKTQLGADSFINEGCMQVHLLSQIHHQNLVSLEGFCHELKHQILVYEYLPGGSLADHLYGPNSQKVSLSWIRRLKIAVDAAKGLDYLHNGSDPRIIHRDVKCSNILLDCEMNAKVCDFGLSKQVTLADATHVTTVVKGTAGYLDPEYYSTQQLTEKSDVYSFGVVLLELICGREPLTHSGTPDSFNLVLWAKPYLQAGALEIVDDNLKGTFDVESMRKAALVTVRCVERDASRRPTIAQVLGELKEAYSLQLAYLASLGHSG